MPRVFVKVYLVRGYGVVARGSQNGRWADGGAFCSAGPRKRARDWIHDKGLGGRAAERAGGLVARNRLLVIATVGAVDVRLRRVTAMTMG